MLGFGVLGFRILGLRVLGLRPAELGCLGFRFCLSVGFNISGYWLKVLG